LVEKLEKEDKKHVKINKIEFDEII
jgi:hypothetical protein